MGFDFSSVIPFEGISDRVQSWIGGDTDFQRQRDVQYRDSVRYAAMQADMNRRSNYEGMMGKLDAAKAAGLHPLAALGAQMGSFSAPTAPGGASASLSFSNDPPPPEPRSPDDPSLKRYNDARARLAEAQADKAEWDLQQQRASSNRLAAQPGNPVSWETSPGEYGVQQPSGTGIKMKDVELLPQTRPGSGLTPGVHPGGEMWRDSSSGNLYIRPAGVDMESSEISNTVRDLSAHYGIDYGAALNLALAGLALWPVARFAKGAWAARAANQKAAVEASNKMWDAYVKGKRAKFPNFNPAR